LKKQLENKTPSSLGYAPPNIAIRCQTVANNFMCFNTMQFVDVNGDGLPDIIHSFYITNMDNANIVYLNNGNGWVPSSEWNEDHQISALKSSNEVLSVKQVAALLSVSESDVMDLYSKNIIQAQDIMGNIRFSKKALIKFLE